MKNILSIILIGFIFISSCKKYEDGPLISLTSKEKRLIGFWYTLIDSTEYQWIIKSNNEIEENAYLLDVTFLFSKEGEWEFDEKKENILINSSFITSDYYYLNENGHFVEYINSGSLSIINQEKIYKINRLTKEDLWIENENELLIKFKKNN